MNEDLGQLDLIELMDRLAPVPEPPAISLWPQTEAWLWAGLVALVFAAWLIRHWILHRRANSYRRAALREIRAAVDSPAALAEILRRTALVAFPRSQVAGLYGDEWLAFLEHTGGGKAFREAPGRAFARAPYAKDAGEAMELAALAARWVRHHRRASEGEL